MKHYLDAAVKARAPRNAAAEFRETEAGEPINQTRYQARNRCRVQELITQSLLKEFPQHALYGEEGIVGDQASEFQWVVDPLDGTVNYYYGIPHYCVSIALRRKAEIIVGTIYDPIRDELWTGQKGTSPKLNGHEFRVSERADLAEAIVSVGLSKTGVTIEAGIPLLQTMVHRAEMPAARQRRARHGLCRVRPSRCYIEQELVCGCSGGLDTGGNGGGSVEMKPRTDMPERYSIIASNGVIDLKL